MVKHGETTPEITLRIALTQGSTLCKVRQGSGAQYTERDPKGQLWRLAARPSNAANAVSHSSNGLSYFSFSSQILPFQLLFFCVLSFLLHFCISFAFLEVTRITDFKVHIISPAITVFVCFVCSDVSQVAWLKATELQDETGEVIKLQTSVKTTSPGNLCEDMSIRY